MLTSYWVALVILRPSECSNRFADGSKRPPGLIVDERELDEMLSRPREADRKALKEMRGDLMLLGAGGKMGPSLAMLARRAAEESSFKGRVIAVSRFADAALAAKLEQAGVEVISTDLLQPGALERLPDCENVIFMAARKFGTTGKEPVTWAINTYLPGRVAERYAGSRIVAFSTGNVYPLVPVESGGSLETDDVAPSGEYAQSALGRERIFEYWSLRNRTPMVLLRLNYAVELRYGVLLDIAQRVFAREPVDVTMPAVNVIWQGDANSICLRAFEEAQTPPLTLNVTGPETIRVRDLALEFGARFGCEPLFTARESSTALLSNASRCHELFGRPSVSLQQMIDWVAGWVSAAGRTFNKPTHYEQRAGTF